jgi:hypothetical protein
MHAMDIKIMTPDEVRPLAVERILRAIISAQQEGRSTIRVDRTDVWTLEDVRSAVQAAGWVAAYEKDEGVLSLTPIEKSSEPNDTLQMIEDSQVRSGGHKLGIALELEQ